VESRERRTNRKKREMQDHDHSYKGGKEVGIIITKKRRELDIPPNGLREGGERGRWQGGKEERRSKLQDN